mmetsp:Transcript_17139/g.35265  ORF Transcript_17139/g.35265 Transcript_17139/m.35265 type:complete len:109 (-) Transcript_17139:107-433(-)
MLRISMLLILGLLLIATSVLSQQEMRGPIHHPGGWNGAIPGDGVVAVWPEVVGLDGVEAAEVIQKARPDLRIVTVVPHDAMVTRDMRFDRVRVYVDAGGKVVRAPRVG